MPVEYERDEPVIFVTGVELTRTEHVDHVLKYVGGCAFDDSVIDHC